MYYLMIQAKPNPGTEHAEETVGAYVGCWIDFKMQEGAEHLARFYIQEAGWTPGKTEEIQWVERKDYEDDPDNLPYYVEAEDDGASLVFFRYTADGEE